MSAAVDYDTAGRLAAIDATVRQAAAEFDLTPERIREALHVIDLLAAAAIDVRRACDPGDKPPYDLLEKARQTWAGSDAETLRLAYDLINQLSSRAEVLL